MGGDPCGKLEIYDWEVVKENGTGKEICDTTPVKDKECYREPVKPVDADQKWQFDSTRAVKNGEFAFTSYGWTSKVFGPSDIHVFDAKAGKATKISERKVDVPFPSLKKCWQNNKAVHNFKDCATRAINADKAPGGPAAHVARDLEWLDLDGIEVE